MKKRMLAIILVVAMLGSLAVSAWAAGSADDRLAAVTLKVKGTLGLDTEEYTDFHGFADEGILASVWYLEWGRDGGSLSISATEEGKILSYYRYDEGEGIPVPVSSAFAPAFPAGSQAEAEQAARAFLDKVLTAGESATIEPRRVSLGATTYRFHGEILINGLSAGLSYSISVRCEDKAITSFNRDDLAGSVVGGVPSAAPAISADQAGSALRGTLALRLEYVVDAPGFAVLRYVPEYGDDYYVDAVTGELVNLSELYRNMYEGDRGDNSAAGGGAAEDSMESVKPEAAPSPSLSPTEQEGVEKLEGVRSREDLDRDARAIAALGLDRYTLSSVTYSVADEPGEDGVYQVVASLRYSRQVEGYSWRRYVTLDARTGELLQVYSSAWMEEGAVERTVDLAAAQRAAEAFLKAQCPGDFALTALYESGDALENGRSVSHSLIYAQSANGYFCPQHTISVGVDATDGSISAYYNNVDTALEFDSPEGIVTMDQAVDAWLGTYDVTLQYVTIPVPLDPSMKEYQTLVDYGRTYLYALDLGYALEREGYAGGIDAKTGEPIVQSYEEDEGLAYGDLAGHWVEEKALRLAQYGVGYLGGSFRPEEELTQLDLIALLVSTHGYLYDPDVEGAADFLYERAYGMGLLDREERDDGVLLTRAETVKFILDAAGYGPVARLEGIFRTKFTDDGAIPASHYGYVALAQGLGMVSGEDGKFLPNDGTTRAEAAEMLYDLMDR